MIIKAEDCYSSAHLYRSGIKIVITKIEADENDVIRLEGKSKLH